MKAINNYSKLILVFLCILHGTGWAQWQPIQVASMSESLNSIYFLSPTSAYVGASTKVFFTNDDFNTFSTSTFKVDIGGNIQTYWPNVINDLHFTSQTEGFCTGIINFQNEYDILKTDNAASHWKFQLNSTSGPLPRFIASFDFENTEAIAAGSNGRLYRSTDGGNNWTLLSSPTSMDLLDIVYLNGTNAMACGEGVLLRSNNNGLSWTSDTSLTSSLLISIAHIAGSNIVYTHSSNVIYRSSNGGATFTPIVTPFNSLNHITALSNDTLIAGTNNGVYISYNSGNNWQQYISTAVYKVNKTAFLSPYLYALCQNGYLLRAPVTTAAQPLAGASVVINEQCGYTEINCVNLSDSSYAHQWFLDGLPVSSNYNYNFNELVDNTYHEIQLIVNNGNATDTFVWKGSINVRKQAFAIAPASFSNCYGAECVLYGTDTLNQTMAWFPWSKLNILFFGVNNDTVITKPNFSITDTILYVVSNPDNCVDTATVLVYVTPPLYEPFKRVVPGIDSTCTNAFCNQITGLQFVSNQTGYGFANTGEFIKTTNGGASYSILNLATQFPQLNWPIGPCDISFVNNNVGYIPWGPLKTTDGGTTWNKLGGNQLTIEEGQSSFISTDTGIVNKTNNSVSEVYLTTDGGNNFAKIFSFANNGLMRIFDIKMVDKNVMYLAGSSNFSGTLCLIQKSTDGGNTWTAYNLPEYGAVCNMSVVSADTVYFITLDNWVISTFDGCQSFQYYFLGITGNYTYRQIAMKNGAEGYVSAVEGSFYKTTNFGQCWTKVFDTPYENSTAIAYTPAKDRIFAGMNYIFDSTAVIYNRQTYRNFDVSIDNNNCSLQPICTHNLCTGYDNYRWYLDNLLITTSMDTCLVFQSAGNHTLKLVADSSGLYKDSVTFAINVIGGIGSIKPMIGDTDVCSNNAIITNYWHDYQVTQNPNAITYHWYATPSIWVLSNLNLETNPLASIYFTPNQNFSNQVTIYCYAETATGCKSDTASVKVSLHHNLPPAPSSFYFNPQCVSTLVSSYTTGNPVDSIYCSTNDVVNNFISYFNFNGVATTQQNAKIPVYAYCPGSQPISFNTVNACGSSATPIGANYNLQYEPTSYIKTSDTVVHYNSTFDLYCFPQYDSTVAAICSNLPYQDWFHNGLLTQTASNYNNIMNATLWDTGYYNVMLYNYCDTSQTSIYLWVDTTNAIQSITELDFEIYSDGYNFYVQNKHAYPITLTVYDALSRKLKTMAVPIGNYTYSLPSISSNLLITDVEYKGRHYYYKFLKK